jgi:lipoprotein-anchoring transpeptidase ErfK/SrfK
MRRRTVVSTVLALLVGAAVAVAVLGGRIGPTAAPVRAAVAADPTLHPAPAIREPKPRVAAGPLCRAGTAVELQSGQTAYAATVVRSAVAYVRPGGARIARFGALNANGVPTVFGVLGARVDSTCQAAWYRVQLPMRPNGRTGWVRASTVSARKVSTRIVVDLSARRVTLFRNGTPILVVTAAIGSPSTPTPTGRYYVNQKLVAPDPWGAYGPVALGISAFSPVLTSWAQGGPIAIHGTNEATLLGSAVSHGCIRVSNSDDLRLFKLAPTGTPVLIRM